MKQKAQIIILSYLGNYSGDYNSYFENRNTITSASSRLQVAPLIDAAKKIGCITSVWSLHNTNPSHLVKIIDKDEIKAVFIGKMNSDNEKSINSMIMANSAAIFLLKSKNIPVILLYSDHHIHRNSFVGFFYRAIMKISDIIITPSTALEEEVDKYTKKTTRRIVVTDPWQAPQHHFKKSNNIEEHVEIIWFGQGSNAQYLLNILPDMFANCDASAKFTLNILTKEKINQLIADAIPNPIQAKKPWSIRFINWNNVKQPSQFNTCLAKSHISIIPSDPRDPKKFGASHNRLLDSIQSGCISVASPLPSYLELSKACLLGNNFSKMINFAISNYERLCIKYESLRDEELSRFSPEKNQQAWEKVIREIVKIDD